MVTQMQGADTRLVNYSSQLNSRYETLKANTRDLVNRWQDYVRDHQSYQSNYSQCVEWVQTLKKRQEVNFTSLHGPALKETRSATMNIFRNFLFSF